VRRLILVVTLAGAALVVPPLPQAAACSCAPVDVGERLPEADGAFVGRLLSRDDPEPVDGALSTATLVRYRYQMERAVKGDIPAGTVDVWSARSGVSCGLETPVGERAGLLLRRQDSRWASSLCEQTDPDALEQAAPAPAPASPTRAEPDGENTGGLPPLAGGAGAGMLAATAAAVIRRRRPPA